MCKLRIHAQFQSGEASILSQQNNGKYMENTSHIGMTQKIIAQTATHSYLQLRLIILQL